MKATTARSSRGDGVRSRPWATPLLVVASVVAALILAEVAARVWVARTWQDERTRFYTEEIAYRDGYEFDPVTGFRPAPGVRVRNAWGQQFHHNALGFRGAEFPREKPPDTRRIVLMGASTIYGFFVEDDETSAVRLLERLTKRRQGESFEVINAGVPGWTTRETVINLERSILPLAPDVIVVMDGRNEVFPEVYNHFRDDYSHYRKLGWDFREVHAGYRRLFQASYLAMLLLTRRGGQLGFSLLAEHPIFGYIRYENRPDLAELERHAGDEGRARAFRRNLERIVAIAQERGIRPLLATVPFLPEKWEATGILDADPRVVPFVTEVVRRNNRIVRALAQEAGIGLIDAESLSKPGLLVDDCHFNAEGEKALSRLLLRGLLPALDGAASGGPAS